MLYTKDEGRRHPYAPENHRLQSSHGLYRKRPSSTAGTETVEPNVPESNLYVFIRVVYSSLCALACGVRVRGRSAPSPVVWEAAESAPRPECAARPGARRVGGGRLASCGTTTLRWPQEARLVASRGHVVGALNLLSRLGSHALLPHLDVHGLFVRALLLVGSLFLRLPRILLRIGKRIRQSAHSCRRHQKRQQSGSAAECSVCRGRRLRGGQEGSRRERKQ